MLKNNCTADSQCYKHAVMERNALNNIDKNNSSLTE